ncbi:MAG: CoA ester lyase [Caldimonas sp.]
MNTSNRAPLAPQRSLLAVPATSPRFLEKAAQSAADAIFIDLEDAVIPSLKLEARASAVHALNHLDWGERIVSVRINGLDTAWGCREILDLAESCPRLDRILIPKCDSPADVRTVETLLRSGEQAAGRERPVRIEALIESAHGVAHVEAIAGSSERLVAMVFGGGDYQLDLGSFQRSVGAPAPDYAVLTDADGTGRRERHWNDLWHFAMARIANACRAYGLAPIDGPFTAIGDGTGLEAAARRAAALGFEGKMAIHPSQIGPINAVFSPSAEQLEWARGVLDAMAVAAAEGRGAVKDSRGEMIDLMHLKLAAKIRERDERLRSVASK